jgi:epoxyqueuosine reductase
VSIYARGEDYHAVIQDKLGSLRDKIAKRAGKFKSMIFVDSSPVGEKALAVRAGIGFIGKNGTLIIPKSKSGRPPGGSFHFLGVIVSDLELKPDTPATGTCGRCRRCIEACPTGAIVADGVIDASRCISYHTTQNKGQVDNEIARKTGNMIFGCDICQIVCPYNKKHGETVEPRLRPRNDMVNIDPGIWRDMTAAEFEIRFRDTAIGDISFAMFHRNVEIAFANTKTSAK